MTKINIDSINIDITFPATWWSCSGSAQFSSELRDAKRTLYPSNSAGIRFAQRIVGADEGQGVSGFHGFCFSIFESSLFCSVSTLIYLVSKSSLQKGKNMHCKRRKKTCMPFSASFVARLCFITSSVVFSTLQLTDFLLPFSTTALRLPISQFQQLLHRTVIREFLVPVMASQLQ